MSELLFLLIPLFAVLDRLWGSEVAFKGKKAAMLLAAMGGGFLAAGVTGLLFGMMWFIYRSPGWDVFGGSATPIGAKQLLGTLARHAIPLPLGLVIVSWSQAPLYGRATVFLAGYALAATILAAWYGQRNKAAIAEGKPINPADNRFLEIARGAAFGLVACFAL